MVQVTQHCECGCETYKIKFIVGEGVWAECSDCGRPTASVSAIGSTDPTLALQKRREWQREQ